MKFRHRREQGKPETLPDVRRVTKALAERIRDMDQHLDGFLAGVAGTAERIRELTLDAERQVEAHDERDT